MKENTFIGINAHNLSRCMKSNEYQIQSKCKNEETRKNLNEMLTELLKKRNVLAERSNALKADRIMYTLFSFQPADNVLNSGKEITRTAFIAGNPTTIKEVKLANPLQSATKKRK